MLFSDGHADKMAQAYAETPEGKVSFLARAISPGLPHTATAPAYMATNTRSETAYL